MSFGNKTMNRFMKKRKSCSKSEDPSLEEVEFETKGCLITKTAIESSVG